MSKRQARATFKRGDWCIYCYHLWLVHENWCPVRALVEAR